jgi:hypothetical protein
MMVVMRFVAVAAVLAGGCSFSTETPGPDPSGLCPFGVTSEYIDPCKLTPPVELDELPEVTITDATAIDTGNGEIVGPNVFTPPPSTVVEGVRVVWTRSFTIASGGTLRAYGDLPLVIVATSTIRIEGTLDASSNPSSRGAGANPMTCAMSTGGPGLQCAQHAGSGGGGGGFGAAGGAGGEGGDTRDCGNALDGQPGGAAGQASTPPATLRGGCAGGGGAPSNAAGGMIGSGGAGGGAISLVARDKVIVGTTGRILAGGGGGQPGRERAGGGGGGAGGMIVIESVDVDLQPMSVVAANGGGGAGGGDGNVADPGEPGLPSTEAADGGDEDPAGGAGGDGGVISAEAGRAGTLADRGGGGGGGGVGFIRVRAKTGSQSGIASPAIAP